MKNNNLIGVLRHVKKFKLYAAISVLFKASNHLASVGFVVLLAYGLIKGEYSQSVLRVFLAALGVLILKYGDEYVSHKMSFLILEQIRNAVFDRYYEIAPGAVEDIKVGDFAQMLVNDINVFEWFIGHILVEWLGFLTAFIIFIALCFPTLGVKVFLLGVPILIMAVLMIFDTDSQEKLGVELKNRAGKIMADVIDGAVGIKDILIYEKEEEYLERIKDNSVQINTAKKNFFSLMSKKSSANELLCLFTLLIIVVSILPASDFYELFLSFVACFSVLKISIMTLHLTQNYGMVYGAAQRVFKIYELQPTIYGYGNSKYEDVGKITLEFKGVSFKYPRKENAVIKNLNFTSNSGERLALVSASGGGKSTITKLLLRFFDPTEGNIFINGINLKTLDEKSLRKLVTIVPQDPFFFDTTLYNNLLYAKPSATEKEIISAAKRANSHEFISKLPEGYHSMIGERGGFLSGGQKQRIALTQAFLKNSPILILDEFSSALDTKNESEIRKTIEETTAEKIVFIISHKVDIIKSAHRILFLNQGELEEVGTYEELVKNEAFRELLQKDL